ncbi:MULTISPECIES: oligosaccharide repeat unit polymerase [unclassified Sulfitobacter]|uniref:oligosaccharide repeat unit polymerase n=1 Tax=unclassified Sulfitobacter TaxID=196795 RepID=UPI0023E155C6|nr:MULTISPECIES: oligosaccharide repeat unit polymerase [unclassified Sulfitobacter]MDF3384616.1 oligosaccharide repeat unit polymerase [Sulfitobacter sp. Ks11]MDF3388104.1 oligosaccharide repeat unit polymerase [Sulfitobacter sp. M85]MDF3391525.1 oligosaccharide repeat unit polymerase [Sulfitobacter sp. Ks16]MDF3402091.1 oligosaccharide repeat unit polymerase [Sulfitobacter sp. KE39]MDF3405583.1 oligosaccharide repeat unit polymerase [Sulfitobacter sp. Ks35]
MFVIFKGSLGLNKQDLYASRVSILNVFQYMLFVIFLSSFIIKDKVSAMLSLLSIVLLSVFLITRSTLILPLASAFFYLLYDKRFFRFLTPVRIAVVTFVAFIAIYGKLIAIGFRTGNYFPLWEKISRTSVSSIMEDLEGYAISYYVVEIVNDPAPYDKLESLDALFQLLVVPDLFGANPSSFTDYLADNYRPDADYGLAYTYFGEGYAVGGFGGIFLWTGILLFMLLITHKLLSKSSNLWVKAWACTALSVLCFYYPRNSLEINLVMLRLTGLSAFLLFLISVFWERVTIKKGVRVSLR